MSTAHNIAEWLANWDGEDQVGEIEDNLRLSDLIYLRVITKRLRLAATRLIDELDELIATELKGRQVIYGDTLYRFNHGGKWVALTEPAEHFAAVAIDELGETALRALFNIQNIRKTGVETVAALLELDPELMVNTILYYDKDPTPGVQEIPRKRWPKYAESKEEGDLF